MDPPSSSMDLRPTLKALLIGRRSPLGAALATVAIVWPIWAVAMAWGGRWSLFADNWFMSLTMVFGSLIAGASSEGGGAVAFPVMTLAFGIAPHVARDFALMIQSVGMIAASLAIVWTGIPIVRGCIAWVSLGGALGIVVGIDFVAPRVEPAYAKMLFTSTWLAFAAALWQMNRTRGRRTIDQLWRVGWQNRAMFVGVGCLGGVVTAITGSGLDILSFSLLVLVFRVSERVATPTSVILMGVNAVIGAGHSAIRTEGLAPEAWNYWWVCVPVVVVGAPLGAQLIRNRSRRFITRILYTSIAVQFMAALWIVPQTPRLLAFSAGVFSMGLLVFLLMARSGRSIPRLRS